MKLSPIPKMLLYVESEKVAVNQKDLLKHFNAKYVVKSFKSKTS